VQTHTQTQVFSEDDDKQLRAELMAEFNTLATIYGKSSVNFIRPEFQIVYKLQPPEHPLDDVATSSGHVPVAPQELPQPNVPTLPVGSAPEPVVVSAAAPPPPADAMVGDLLGFDGPPAPVPSAPAPTSSGTIALAPAVTMSGDEYQSIWGSIPDADAVVETVALSGIPPSTGIVESALGTVHVFTMASGELPAEFKFFLYAQDSNTGNMFLVQSNIMKGGEPLMILTVKVTGGSENAQSKVDQLTRVIQGVLG
jgi:hypothetical protein